MPTSFPLKITVPQAPPISPTIFLQPRKTKKAPAPLTGSWTEPMELWTWFLSAESHQKNKFLARKCFGFLFQAAGIPLDFLSVETSIQALVIYKAKQKNRAQHHGWVNTEVMRETLVMSGQITKGNRKWWAGENERLNVKIT